MSGGKPFAMTPALAKALAFVDANPGAYPAMVGWHVCPTRKGSTRPLVAQGAGRLGGGLLWKLQAAGYVGKQPRRRGGWETLAAGRAYLAAQKETGR